MNKKIVRFLFVLLSVVVLISCWSVTAYAKETAKTEKTETTTAAGQDLFDVADANLLMPPKSTWFEPKLRSGLFIHRI